MKLPFGRESGRSHREFETSFERVCQRRIVLQRAKAIETITETDVCALQQSFFCSFRTLSGHTALFGPVQDHDMTHC
jgi:hypothetical protein